MHFVLRKILHGIANLLYLAILVTHILSKVTIHCSVKASLPFLNSFTFNHGS